LLKIINKERDCIYIYKLPDKKFMEREVVGIAKALFERIY